MSWYSWPSADGPEGVLSRERPYVVTKEGRVVVTGARRRAVEAAREGRRGRRAARPLTVAMEAYFRQSRGPLR